MVYSHVNAGGTPAPCQCFRIDAAARLRGASPAEMPVEQPTRYILIAKLKTGKVLGLTVPPSILAQAGEVIE